jgi:hypothetical protein
MLLFGITMTPKEMLSGAGLSSSEPARSHTCRADEVTWWSRTRAMLRVVQVRLRFVAIFLVAFLVIGNWETLSNYWDRLTAFSTSEAPQAVSSNTEYFCPMCPGVISDWPSKCPVCNMALVRRKKGGPVQLPDGVVSRMQYSPYRLQLAGVRTSVVDYLPLAREVVAFGLVQAAGVEQATTDHMPRMQVDLQLGHDDAAMLRAGQLVEIHCVARPAQGPWSARVHSVEYSSPSSPLMATVRVEIDNPHHELSPGMEVSAAIQLPVIDVEPFNSQPTDPEPLRPNEPRSAFVCPEHVDVVGEAGGKCPRDGLDLVEQPLSDNQRLRYWCPMHSHVTATQPGERCDECSGMLLLPRVVTYRPPGEVLAVPESAVINTGKRHVVYVDRGAGMFEGVEVLVGPRAAGYYPIARGLQAGQKVVSAGAFLLDAETRLHANVSAAYFGATTNLAPMPSPDRLSTPVHERSPDTAAEQADLDAALSQLAAEDERLARSQRICPVTQLRLGSMGKPVKALVKDRIVFLCCAGCRHALLNDPDKYLLQLSSSESPD